MSLLCLALSFLTVARADIPSNGVEFLEEPEHVMRSIFQPMKLAMEEINDGYIIHADGELFHYRLAEYTNAMQYSRCFVERFSVQYKFVVDGDHQEERAVFQCANSSWVLSLKLPLDSRVFGPQYFIAFNWFDDLGHEKQFELYLGKDNLRIKRDKIEGWDTLFIHKEGERGFGDMRISVKDGHGSYVIKSVFNEQGYLQSSLVLEQREVRGSLPHRRLLDAKTGRELELGQFAEQYQMFFKDLFPLIVPGRLF